MVALPADFHKLSKLHVLCLTSNFLRNAVIDYANLDKFSQLTHLYIAQNEIGPDVPEGLAKCNKLIALSLSRNRIQSADRLGRLTNLEWLGLSENELQSLPSTFANLKNLKGITLANNPLDDGSAYCSLVTPPSIVVAAPRIHPAAEDKEEPKAPILPAAAQADTFATMTFHLPRYEDPSGTYTSLSNALRAARTESMSRSVSPDGRTPVSPMTSGTNASVESTEDLPSEQVVSPGQPSPSSLGPSAALASSKSSLSPINELATPASAAVREKGTSGPDATVHSRSVHSTGSQRPRRAISGRPVAWQPGDEGSMSMPELFEGHQVDHFYECANDNVDDVDQSDQLHSDERDKIFQHAFATTVSEAHRSHQLVPNRPPPAIPPNPDSSHQLVVKTNSAHDCPPSLDEESPSSDGRPFLSPIPASPRSPAASSTTSATESEILQIYTEDAGEESRKDE